MKCRFCGGKIEKDSNVCSKCGKEVTEGLGTDELIDAMPDLHDEFDNISKLQNKSKHSKKRIVIAIILIVAILLAGGFGAYWYKTNNKPATPENSVVTTSAVDSKFQAGFIGGGFTKRVVTDAASAKEVLNDVKDSYSFSMYDVENEYVLKNEIKIGNSTIYRFQQMFEGIPVYRGEMVVFVSADNYVMAVNGAYIETKGLINDYTIDTGTASTSLTEYVNAISDFAVKEGINITEAEKYICNTNNKAYLAYKANVSGYNSKGEYLAYDAFIDGDSGNGICVAITSSYENESAVVQEDVEESYIYEMATAGDKFNWNDEKMTLAVEPIRISDVESGNSSNYVASVKTSVDDAYNFFDGAFGWKGLAGNGEKFKVYINPNEYTAESLPKEHAMYTDDKLMFFQTDLTQGGANYNVVVHEYAHGVMHNIVGFDGTKVCSENAAIAEGLADVFAELAEASLTGAAPDWVHGERNLFAPGEGYHTTYSGESDITDVTACYQYSTIVSHMAAYMSQYVPDMTVQNEFWFKTMCLMTGNTNFDQFKSILSVVSADMYSEGKFDDTQMNAIQTGIEMLGHSSDQ